MKLDEIADKVRAHLRRIEADPKLNTFDPPRSTRPYYVPNAWKAGTKMGVRYVSYQGDSFLSKAEALRYLEWLDQGRIGKHFDMDRE